MLASDKDKTIDKNFESLIRKYDKTDEDMKGSRFSFKLVNRSMITFDKVHFARGASFFWLPN